MEPIRPLSPYERDRETIAPVRRVGPPPDRLREEQQRRKRREREAQPEQRDELPEGSEHIDTTA